MKKINPEKMFILLLLIIIVIVLTAFNKSVENKKMQEKLKNKQIEILSEKNEEYEKRIIDLQKEITKLEFSINSNVEYDKGGFNYLALGNSITWHEKCDYWWNEIGMAASKPENDFFHLVTKYLEENNEKVKSYAFKYINWELQNLDRAGTYTLLKPYLSTDIDLITLQLSENATELSTFESDLEDLIEYISLKCPDAQIILIDDFWDDEKSDMKKKIALKCNVDFVDLTEIRDNSEYQSELGSIVYGDNNQEHIIFHNGVATHPGDKGMKYIADRIIEYLK